jgi:hypothetical protein
MKQKAIERVIDDEYIKDEVEKVKKEAAKPKESNKPAKATQLKRANSG